MKARIALIVLSLAMIWSLAEIAGADYTIGVRRRMPVQQQKDNPHTDGKKSDLGDHTTMGTRCRQIHTKCVNNRKKRTTLGEPPKNTRTFDGGCRRTPKGCIKT